MTAVLAVRSEDATGLTSSPDVVLPCSCGSAKSPSPTSVMLETKARQASVCGEILETILRLRPLNTKPGQRRPRS